MATHKEYLNPTDWSLHLVNVDNTAAGKDWIEVPDGADYLIKIINGIPRLPAMFFRHKDGFFEVFYEKWGEASFSNVQQYINDGDIVLWQRHKQPESLPFVDDEKPYNHYYKDVSNLEFIDVYRVLDLFAVEHPCIQHAVKKLLCAGQRGSKNRDKDIKEAIDSLKRFQEMRIEDNRDGEWK